jgi:hypothetical protein
MAVAVEGFGLVVPQVAMPVTPAAPVERMAQQELALHLLPVDPVEAPAVDPAVRVVHHTFAIALAAAISAAVVAEAAAQV